MQALRVQSPTSGRKVVLLRPGKATRRVVPNAFSARPYTVRKEDTLSSIARKRGFDMQEVLKLNYGIDPDNLQEGQTLLLPAGSLSERDKEILAGVGPGSYRTYPVRKGENINDILSKRKITMAEFQKLNPEVDPDRLKENQILKLPSNKFTVREREMLTGTGIVPSDFFESGSAITFGGGVAAGVAAAIVYAWAKQNKDE